MSDLLKDYNEIMKYWDFKKNKNIDLSTIKNGSGKKAWCKCPKCHGKQ